MKILDIGCDGKKYVSGDPEDVVVGLDIQKFPDAADYLEGFLCG
jgi:hypothetical protein